MTPPTENASPASRWRRVGHAAAAVLLACGLVAAALALRHATAEPDVGLRGRYFDNASFGGAPATERVDREVDFDPRRDPFFARKDVSAEWTGFVALPEAGRYGFCLQADLEATLEVDGHPHANARKLRMGKWSCGELKVTEAALKSIKIRWRQTDAGDGFVRLLWEPPPRAWDPQRLPGGVLFPDRVPEARWRAASLVPLRDGVTWVAILLIATACLLFLLRFRLRACARALRDDPEARRSAWAFGAVVVVALVPRCVDLLATGELCDEAVLWSQGRNFLRAWLDLDFREETWRIGWTHTPLTKYMVGFGSLFTNQLTLARLLAAGSSALACGIAFLIGRDLFGLRAGLFAGLAGALLPHWIGHGMVGGHEAPTTLFQGLAIWLLVRAIRAGGNSPLYLWAGVATGLAGGLRQTNAVLAIAVGFAYVILRAAEMWRRRRPLLPLNSVLLFVVAGAVVFAMWPTAWPHPIELQKEIFARFQGESIGHEWFLGTLGPKPWMYIPVYSVITVPMALLAAAALGVLRLFVPRTMAAVAMLLVWWAANMLPALGHAVKDGVRYGFGYATPLCVLAGAGLAWLVDAAALWLTSARARLGAACVVGACAFVPVLVADLRIRPYYIDYYNELVGGLRAAHEKKLARVGWWNEGTQAAYAFLNRHAAKGDTVYLSTQPGNHIQGPRPDLRVVPTQDAQWALFTHETVNPVQPQWEPVHVVGHDGVPFATVYRRRAAPGPR